MNVVLSAELARASGGSSMDINYNEGPVSCLTALLLVLWVRVPARGLREVLAGFALGRAAALAKNDPMLA